MRTYMNKLSIGFHTKHVKRRVFVRVCSCRHACVRACVRVRVRVCVLI